MSAWIVSRDTIDLLVSASLQAKRQGHLSGDLSLLSDDELGKLLWTENLRSVQHRYPSEDLELDAYEFQSVFPLPPDAALVKAVHYYEYQSCEHAEWSSSAAHDLCQRLIGWLTTRMPGYDAAPWVWERPQRRAR